MAKPTLIGLLLQFLPVDLRTVHWSCTPYSPLQWTVRSDAGDYSM
ncbi:MAG: hypothetical protein V8T40_05350 [Phocaeicola vulgatus]